MCQTVGFRAGSTGFRASSGFLRRYAPWDLAAAYIKGAAVFALPDLTAGGPPSPPPYSHLSEAQADEWYAERPYSGSHDCASMCVLVTWLLYPRNRIDIVALSIGAYT